MFNSYCIPKIAQLNMFKHFKDKGHTAGFFKGFSARGSSAITAKQNYAITAK